MKKKIIFYASLLWSVWSAGVSAATSQQFVEQEEIYRGLASEETGFTVPNQAEYAVIWQRQSDGAIWQARHGMSEMQYQRAAEKMRQEGFRVVHVSGHGADKMVRFVGIWTERGNIDWLARHNLTLDEYQSIDRELTADGFSLTSLNDYQIYGESRYAAVWQRDKVQLTHEPSRYLISEYQKAFDELIQKGYKLIHVNQLGHHQNGRYSALWWKRQPVGLIGSRNVFNYFSQVKQDNRALQDARNSLYLP